MVVLGPLNDNTVLKISFVEESSKKQREESNTDDANKAKRPKCKN